MENQNYMTGGTGAALFGGGTGAAASQAANQAIGDEYVAPAGLPDWKQPSFDDDDRVDPDKHLEYKPTVRGCITQRSWCKVKYFFLMTLIILKSPPYQNYVFVLFHIG